MKKIALLLLSNPRIFKFLIVCLFLGLFILSINKITSMIAGTFKIYPIIFIFLITGWLIREGIILLFNKYGKRSFPTTYLPNKLGKIFDKFFNLGITLFFLAIGINPLTMFIKTHKISTEFKIDITFIALSIWVFSIYAIGTMLGTVYYYYRTAYLKSRALIGNEMTNC